MDAGDAVWLAEESRFGFVKDCKRRDHRWRIALVSREESERWRKLASDAAGFTQIGFCDCARDRFALQPHPSCGRALIGRVLFDPRFFGVEMRSPARLVVVDE